MDEDTEQSGVVIKSTVWWGIFHHTLHRRGAIVGGLIGVPSVQL